ncbi:hypothetical protein GCM10023339_03230 [Alloalcanivorax gelatiniphagus]
MHDDTRVRRGRGARAPVAVAAAVALVVAAAVALPRLLADDLAPVAGTATGTDCVEDVDADLGALEEEVASSARWVRFCPIADEGATQRVRHPSGVVTGDLAAAVATGLWQTQVDRPVCSSDDLSTPAPTGLFRMEVGLADGRVAELAGDTGCSTRDATLFSQLESTLLMDAAGSAGVDGSAPAPVTCPGRLTAVRTNRDGSSAAALVETAEHEWHSSLPLLPMPAVALDVCAYTGSDARWTLQDQWQVGSPVSEQVRAAATVGIMRGAMTDCGIDPARTSYVVVLTDGTGTARTLAIDGAACGTVQAAIGTPAVGTHLGLATSALVRLVARSRP